MSSYSDDELRLIEAARRSLEADKVAKRRSRMLMSGVPPEEADRRLQQSYASRMAHYQSRAVLPPIAAQESIVETKKAPPGLPEPADMPISTPGIPGKVLAYLGKKGTSTALQISRAVVDFPASKSDINPTLYKLQDRGLVVKSDLGWRLVRDPWYENVSGLLRDRPYSIMELMALLSVPYETITFVLDELESQGNLAKQHHEAPSGVHIYYSIHCVAATSTLD